MFQRWREQEVYSDVSVFLKRDILKPLKMYTLLKLLRKKIRKGHGVHLMAAADSILGISVLTYPGLYFATLSAETNSPSQTSTVPHSYSWVIWSSSLTHSLQSCWKRSETAQLFIQMEFLSSLKSSVFYTFLYQILPSSVFLLLGIIAVANLKPIWHFDQVMIIQSCNVCVCVCVCILYMHVWVCFCLLCVSSQFTGLGSVRIRQSQCYLSVLAAQFLSQSHVVVA